MHAPKKCHFNEYEEIPLGQCDGISGGLRVRGRGTLRIRIGDDHGWIHIISIPNSLLIPGLPMLLISPQHWDQEASPAESMTTGGKCVIKWGQHLEYCKPIAHSMSSNTPRLRMTSGNLQFQAYSAAIDHLCKQALSKETTVLHEVIDSEEEPEDELEERFHDCFEDEDEVSASINNHDEFRDEDFVWGLPETKEPATLSFNEMEQPKILPHIHNAKNLTVECDQADLLHWHYPLVYSPFKILKALAIIGILPYHLAKAQTPMCPACSFAKMHQRPWRTKSQHKRKIGKRITRPSQHVSIDQQELSQVGFFAQLKERLTKN